MTMGTGSVPGGVDAAATPADAFRALAGGAALPIYIYDRETLRFLEVNAAAVHTYGWSPEEFRARTIRDIRPTEDLPRLDALLVVASLLLGHQPPGVEASSRRRYGSPFGEQRPSGHLHLFTRRALHEAFAANGFRVDAYREARFSSSWWQAVRSDRKPTVKDWIVGAALATYDLIPFRKDVMVVRASLVEERA